MISLKVNGLEQVIKDLGKLSKESNIEVKGALTAWAINTQNDAKQLVASEAKDTGQLLNSIQYKVEGFEASVSANTEYAAFVEFGTRKFASQYVSTLPPDWQQYANTFKGKKTGNFDTFLARLIEWGRKKGLNENQSYKLALKILRDGTRQKPFLYPSFNKNFPIFIKDLKQIFK